MSEPQTEWGIELPEVPGVRCMPADTIRAGLEFWGPKTAELWAEWQTANQNVAQWRR